MGKVLKRCDRCIKCVKKKIYYYRKTIYSSQSPTFLGKYNDKEKLAPSPPQDKTVRYH
jgi:hypothetical protein